MARCWEHKQTPSAHELTVGNLLAPKGIGFVDVEKPRQHLRSLSGVLAAVQNWRLKDDLPRKAAQDLRHQRPHLVQTCRMPARQVVPLEFLRKTRWRRPPWRKRSKYRDLFGLVCNVWSVRMAAEASPANPYMEPSSYLASQDCTGIKPSETTPMAQKRHQDGCGWPHV